MSPGLGMCCLHSAVSSHLLSFELLVFLASSSNIKEDFPDPQTRPEAPIVMEFITRSMYVGCNIKNQLRVRP